MQCFCSIAGAQLLTRFSTNIILAVSMFCFGALGLVLIIIEAATGGYVDIANGSKWYPGNWPVEIIFAIYLPMGGCLGVVELLRRVIPRDIVGENPEKLMKMDATVHILYEIAGTSGAFASAATIKKLGPVYALFVIPVFFTLSGIAWLNVRITTNYDKAKFEDIDGIKVSKRSGVIGAFRTYFFSVKRGAQIIFSERRFVWLITGYSLPLVFHRFIENNICNTFANKVLKEGAYQGLLVGGSNFGELLGALAVLLVGTRIHTPLPWVRLDALTLSILWIYPFLRVAPPLTRDVWPWAVLPLMMVLSGGWAAGDVSLVAYVQSRLHSSNIDNEEGTSPLGCVMAFLYSAYLIIYTCLSIPLGKVFDDYYKREDILTAFIYIAGVMMAIGGAIIFASTFIPKGSCALNPKIADDDVVVENEEDPKANNTVVA